MKIYYRGRHIKNVPRKYASIPDLPDYFEDIHSRVLSFSEYTILDLVLFAEKIEPFIEGLRTSNPAAFESIKNSSPLKAYEVHTTDGLCYHSLLFRNRKSIRIDKNVFRKCPVRRKANWPSPNVALPPFKQLKLF